MKIVQLIYTTGCELYGLDADGNVYVYTRGYEPHKRREPEFAIITRKQFEDYQNQMANQSLNCGGTIRKSRDPGHSHQIMAAKQEEPWQQAYPVPVPMGMPAPLPPGYLAENKQAYDTRREMEAQKHYIEERCIQTAGCEATGVVRHGDEFLQHIGYKDVFTDGMSEGWLPLSMKVSKPVPHKDDPTKCERS